MPKFLYKAADKSGKISSGSVEAADRRAAMRIVGAGGLRVISVSADDSKISEPKKPEASSAQVKGGEKTALMFFKKIHRLCKSGTPVGDALRGLSGRSLNKNMASLARSMYKSLSEGRNLAQAMADFPKIFEKSLCHLVEAGESTANLVPVFENIIEYLENKRALRKQILSALIYPAVLFTVAFIVVMLFLFVLLPQIESMMQSLGGEMGLPVKILMGLGGFMLKGGPIIAALSAAAVAAVYRLRQTPQGRLFTDRLLLKIPLAGKIALDSDIARFSNLISTLLVSGVNMTETLKLAEKSIKNTDIKIRFAQCRTAVNDGAAVSQTLKKFALLADDDIDIVSVGDRTGDLSECFREVKQIHMETLSANVKFAITSLSSFALLSAFILVFLVALGIVSAVLGLSQTLV